MSKELVIKQGYLLKVTSWENDGDNYRTKEFQTTDKEYAFELAKACYSLFKSCNNGEGGVGNSFEDDYPEDTIIKYVDENPGILDGNHFDTEEAIYSYIQKLAHDLMGGSESYEFRVCESVELIENENNALEEHIDITIGPHDGYDLTEEDKKAIEECTKKIRGRTDK